jgi:hypothetical protein
MELPARRTATMQQQGYSNRKDTFSARAPVFMRFSGVVSKHQYLPVRPGLQIGPIKPVQDSQSCGLPHFVHFTLAQGPVLGWPGLAAAGV